mmetsp:Transcript_12464/g.34611  ORF Transcript_12464/g.34611 Transcript_12464/m.34611 type:complete len:127 (+) Transcript_12464:157-537(+)
MANSICNKSNSNSDRSTNENGDFRNKSRRTSAAWKDYLQHLHFQEAGSDVLYPIMKCLATTRTNHQNQNAKVTTAISREHPLVLHNKSIGSSSSSTILSQSQPSRRILHMKWQQPLHPRRGRVSRP